MRAGLADGGGEVRVERAAEGVFFLLAVDAEDPHPAQLLELRLYRVLDLFRVIERDPARVVAEVDRRLQAEERDDGGRGAEVLRKAARHERQAGGAARVADEPDGVTPRVELA